MPGTTGGARRYEHGAAQQRDQAVGPSRHAACLRKLRAGLARCLSCALDRRLERYCFLNTTTPRTISRQGGFGPLSALFIGSPHCRRVSASRFGAGLWSSRIPSLACLASRRRRCRKWRAISLVRCTRNADSVGPLVATKAAYTSRSLQPSHRRRTWRCGSESRSESLAVQPADQPDALRRVMPLACASGSPRLARGLSATLYGYRNSER